MILIRSDAYSRGSRGMRVRVTGGLYEGHEGEISWVHPSERRCRVLLDSGATAVCGHDQVERVGAAA